MTSDGIHAVTGAFGYSGKYIARRLLAAGQRVRTLTNSGGQGDPFGGRVEVAPLCFSRPHGLVAALRGVAVLYNTYWIRFNHRRRFSHKRRFSHAEAVNNTKVLFRAAREAGVGRIVHVSITNPDPHSELEYFAGKAELERALRETGIGHAILRPTVLFGAEDILINNIAWMLRTFPLFGLFGRGRYRLQPIYVDDLARLAVEQGLAVERGLAVEDVVIDAIGPETFTYRQLVRVIGQIIGKPRPLVPLPPLLGWLAGKLVGRVKGDVTITRPEIAGLMQERLYVDAPPAGTTRLTEWAAAHASTLGLRYASELARREPGPAAPSSRLRDMTGDADGGVPGQAPARET
jgi:NADH dehydrogenase